MRIFNLRFGGDFQNDRIAIDTVDGAIDAAVGDHFIAGLELREHGLHFLALALLRHDHHEIHDGEHEPSGIKKPPKPRRP